MIVNRLNNRTAVNQAKFSTTDSAVDLKMEFVLDLVREHAKPVSQGLELDIDDLELIDKNLLLAHFASPCDYEYSQESFAQHDEIWCEYHSMMQDAVNDACATEYHEAMREMGLHLNRHADNGEWYYSR